MHLAISPVLLGKGEHLFGGWTYPNSVMSMAKLSPETVHFIIIQKDGDVDGILSPLESLYWIHRTGYQTKLEKAPANRRGFSP